MATGVHHDNNASLLNFTALIVSLLKSEVQSQKSQENFTRFSLFVCLWGIELCQSNFVTYFVINRNEYYERMLRLTIVVSVRPRVCPGCCYLKTEQAKMLNPQNQNNLRSLMLFIVEWRLIFAIFHFWRRKFDHDPGLTFPLNVQVIVLNGFRRQFPIQNRIHLSKLKKHRLEIGFLGYSY